MDSIAVLLALLALATGTPPVEQPPLFGVRGTVVDVGGNPVGGAAVRLILDSPKGGKLADQTRTDAAGRFGTRGWIVSRSDGEGEWRIEVAAAGRATSVVDELFGGFGEYDIGRVYLFRPVEVSGRVSDARGRPIAGARVWAAPGHALWSPLDHSAAGPVAVTRSDGTYSFRTLPPGVATVGVEAAGFADAVRRDATFAADSATSIDFELRRELPVTGVVVTPQGEPIAAARIDVRGRGFWRTAEVADAVGRFAVPGSSDAAHPSWEVTALGFVSHRREGEPPGGEIVLRRSAQLTLRVDANSAGERPAITQVSVRRGIPPEFVLCGNCDSMNWVDVHAGSDFVAVLDPWTWRVDSEAALSCSLEDREANYRLPGPVRVRLADGSRSSHAATQPWSREAITLHVRAPDSGAILGRVVETDPGTPLAGTTVLLNHWSVTEPFLRTTTDSDGRFRFSGVAPHEHHRVKVESEAWRGSTRVAVTAGDETECVVRVSRPPRVAGTVVVNGAPPEQPVVVGLERGWSGLGVSDAQGAWVVVPKWSREMEVVPKRLTGPSDGGYRRFRSEFPDTRNGWPWRARPAKYWTATVDIDLADVPD